MSDEKTYEMLWDCEFCGTKKLLGKTHRFCPSCGAAQDPKSRYYPSDEEKVAVEDHVYVGVDKTCSSCDTLNSASAEFCTQCGAPLDAAAAADRLAEQSRAAEGAAFESSGSRDMVKEGFDAEMQRVGVQTAPGAKKGGLSLMKIGLLVVGALVVVGVLAALFWKQDAAVHVTGHTWERTIQIEAFGPQASSAWCDSMPAGAYSITRRSEQRSSRQIPDGEDCRIVRQDRGDGTFTERRECTPRYRSEPVYDDRCYFTINIWSYGRRVQAGGDSVSDELIWPNTNIQQTGTCVGCEREGQRSETYQVMLRAGEKDYVCSVPLERWQAMPVESAWKVDVGVISGQPDCNSIEPAG